MAAFKISFILKLSVFARKIAKMAMEIVLLLKYNNLCDLLANTKFFRRTVLLNSEGEVST